MNNGIPVVLKGLRPLAPDLKEFRLAREGGGDLPAWSAGSHILVSLPVGGKHHLNSYSLLGPLDDLAEYRIAVRRVAQSRGGSHFLHDQAAPGLRLSVSYPVNLFALSKAARHHVLVAGGIGVTPILAQARQLKAWGASFEVHYAYRSPDQAAYAEDLKVLAGKLAFFTCDSQGTFLDFKALLAGRPLGTHVYVCGPDGLRLALYAEAHRLGWPSTALHSEQFVHAARGAAFSVELRKTGVTLKVTPDTSLLEAIEEAGVDAPYLCRGGACGRCETEVLEAAGKLIHQDVYLSEAEKAACNRIMPCVSRFEGEKLVLNL